jgi:antitoxin component YwqK of YwqJK toxin-antitoxin module
MSSRIQIRRDTAANWHSVNPELLSGELGYETNTGKLKIGTGAHWDDTPYFVYENTKLDNLNDVTIVDVANGDFLRYDSSASVWINDAVNLSTDTIGDYVESLVEGAGIVISNNSGEGATPTIAVDNYDQLVTSASLEMRLASEHWHKGVRLATTEPLPDGATYTPGEEDSDGGFGLGAVIHSTSNARLSIDGNDAASGDRVLILNQVDATENGVYVVVAQGSTSAHWSIERAADMNGSVAGQVTQGESIGVREGFENNRQQFAVESLGSGTGGVHIFGTDNISFTRYSGTNSFNAGDGLSVSGNTLNIISEDSSRIFVSGSSIDLAQVVRYMDVSGSADLNFIKDVETDDFGRVLGVTKGEVSLSLQDNTTGDYIEHLTASTGITIEGSGAHAATAIVSVTPGTYDPFGSAASVYYLGTNFAQSVGDAANLYADSLAVNYDPAGSASTAQTNAENYADSLATNYDPAGSASTAQTNAENYADSLASNYDPAGAASTAQTNAENYADSLASNYDPTGAASTAQTNAENYADSLASNYDPAGSASTAETNAKNYADTLAGNYDPAGSASTAQQNAENYADGLAANYDIAGAANSAYTNAASYADGLASNYDAAGAAGLAYTNATGYADALAANYDPAGSASAAYTDATAYADGLAANYDPSGSAATAETNAKNYADNLATNYDSAGSAATAETNAKNYADGLASNYDPAGSASTAQTNAENYADGLASNYDTAGSASTAQTNAENYADGLTYAIDDLTDVAISTPAIDNVLVWNGTNWVNQNSIHLKSTVNSTDSDSGALIIDGGLGVKKDIHTDGVIHAGTAPTVSLDNAVAYFSGNESGVVQLGLQNQSSASVSSADYVATADNGNDTSKYLDLGINSSTYADPDYSATGANDGYLYVDGGNLVIGTATGDKDIKFNIGGTQSTDIMGTWSETVLDIATNFSVSGSANFTGDIVTQNADVTVLTAHEIIVDSPSASVVAAKISGYSGQTANLTEWKNSAGTTLARVDKDGNITAPVFIGTNIGNVSFYGINTSASTMYKGQPIYLTGLDSPSGNPTIALSNVADPAKMPGAGIVAEDILAGDTGEVVMIGQILNVDTSGWNYNDILYVDGLGTLTNVKPTDPNHSVQTIGNVEKVGTALGGGAILVNCTGTFVEAPNTIAIPGSVTASAGFYGSGANVTSLNANNLSAGTVPSARLSLTSSDIPTLTASKISDFATTAKGYTLDSFAVPVAAISMNSQKITNMADPTSGADAATKSYVDNLSSGLRIKQAVNRATNAVLPNTPTYHDGAADSSQGLGDGAYLESATNTRLSVDGGNVSTGQRVLVKDQATASHNGIYYVTEQGGGGVHWVLTRADDSNNTPAGEVRKGDYVSVLVGSANAGTSWTIANDGTATTPLNGIKIGTDAINWIQFNGAASYVAGGGMTLSGTTFDVATASSDRIVINADSIDLATVSRSDTSGSPGGTRITSITTDSYGRVTGTVSSAQSDATTTTKGIASFDSGDFSVSSGAVTIKTGGVGNTQLENSSVTIGSSSVSLGGTTSSLTGLSSVSATTFTGNLTGSVSGNASTVTNGVYTTDTGTVTNTMLSGSIADTKLSTISTTGKVSNSATTATSANTASAIVARDASGNFTANIITADLSGNATTATSATSATNATNAAITDTTTTAGTYYPVFSSTSTGNSTLRTDSTGLTYNPSTNTLTASTFSGALSGNASTATSATTAASLTTGRAIALTGDVTGSVTFDGSASVSITTTIAADSVVLGTDTTGNYVSSLVAGTGVTLSNNTGEGATPTVAIGQAVSTSSNVTFNNVIASGLLTVGTGIGSEGGEIQLAPAVTGNTLTGNIVIDIYQNKLRIFENGGTTRGVYIDLSAATGGVGTNLITTPGSTTLIGLTDVTASAAASGDYLKYNGSKWVNQSGVVNTADTGTVTNTMLAGSIADSKLSTISTAGKVSNSATTATASNTASAIVARDSSGNFTAGTITATSIATASTYIGTTQIALNRSSANQSLDGILSVTLPGSTSGTVQLIPTAAVGTGTVLTIPATTGTIITTGDSGTVTNTMLAGSIADTKLSTISTANKVSNSATTATSANTASAIVARDSSGNFTAGTITATAIATAATYIGTTQVALNRSSANLALTGISSVALPGSTSGTVTLQPTATAGTTTITLPATTGTVITTGDSGTVTSTMIADGTIVNADISTTAAIDLGKLADVSTTTASVSYTLVLTDKNKIVEISNASANTLTVPLNSSVAFPVGSQITFIQTGAGQTTITPTGGVTINGTPGLKLRAQWSSATLIKRATDTWVAIGDLSA